MLHFFQKLIYMTTSVLGYCAFSNLRTAVKVFAAVFQIKEAKIIVVEDTGHKCTCNNPTREIFFCFFRVDFLLFSPCRFSPVSRMKCF